MDVDSGAERQGRGAVAGLKHSRWARIAVLALAAVAGTIVLIGLPPGPAALPPGASPLSLRTQPSPIWRFPMGGACALGLLLPVQVVRDGDALQFVSEADGQRVAVVWPGGFSARLLDGRAELVTPGGRVFAGEGDVLRYLYGAAADDGSTHLCFGSPVEYEWAP